MARRCEHLLFPGAIFHHAQLSLLQAFRHEASISFNVSKKEVLTIANTAAILTRQATDHSFPTLSDFLVTYLQCSDNSRFARDLEVRQFYESFASAHFTTSNIPWPSIIRPVKYNNIDAIQAFFELQTTYYSKRNQIVELSPFLQADLCSSSDDEDSASVPLHITPARVIPNTFIDRPLPQSVPQQSPYLDPLNRPQPPRHRLQNLTSSSSSSSDSSSADDISPPKIPVRIPIRQSLKCGHPPSSNPRIRPPRYPLPLSKLQKPKSPIPSTSQQITPHPFSQPTRTVAIYNPG